MIRLCKNCKHCEQLSGWQKYWWGRTSPYCLHPNGQKPNLVNGKIEAIPAWIAREFRCGEAAVWFEPREAIGAESDEFLYGRDEREPNRYRGEDERLDDPRHDQCIAGKFKE